MKNSMRLFIGLVVAGSTLVASAQMRGIDQKVTAPKNVIKVDTAKGQPVLHRFGNLATGEEYPIDTISTRVTTVDAFDTMHTDNDNPLIQGAPDTGEGINYSWADGTGANWCDYNEANATYLSINPLSALSCDGITDADMRMPALAGATCAAWDLLFDYYVVDAVNWEGDPNTTRDIPEIGFVIGITDAPQVLRIIFGWFEYFDRNGDGAFCEMSGGPWFVDLSFASNAQWWYTLDFRPGFFPAIPGHGFFMFDVGDETVDPNTGVPTGVEACGIYFPIAGGITNDASCQTPDMLMQEGQASHVGWGELDAWVFQMWDAQDLNCAPIDANSACDPNFPGTTYGDVWNKGYGIFLTWQDGATGYYISRSFCWRLAVDNADIPGCGPGCETPGGYNADIGPIGGVDCLVNLTDLGDLLLDFGSPCGSCVGDLNGDGNTDLTDLGEMLLVFGATCP